MHPMQHGTCASTSEDAAGHKVARSVWGSESKQQQKGQPMQHVTYDSTAANAAARMTRGACGGMAESSGSGLVVRHSTCVNKQKQHDCCRSLIHEKMKRQR